MEKAQVLVRTAARAFYTAEHVIVIDALIKHSALSQGDIRLILDNKRAAKDISKTCAELERGGLLCTYVRSEIKKQGAGKPSPVKYYYIDYRCAVDSIKYRLHILEDKISKHSKPTAEKKPYRCERCKSEFTMLDVMDNKDPQGRGSGFLCKTCGAVLPPPPRGGESAADTEVGIFNRQFLPIINLLRQIDHVVVPAVTAESALEEQRPVPRGKDPAALPKVEPIEEQKIRPTAVKGIRPAVEQLEVSITTEMESNAAARAAEEEHRARIAAQNQMPVWHTQSTVSGEAVRKGSGTVDTLRNGTAVNGVLKDEEAEDKKELEQDTIFDDYALALAREQAEAQRRREEEAEDEDETDDEEDEFEDVPAVAYGASPVKRSFDDDSTSNAASTPATKKVRLEDPAGDSATGTPLGRSESDADEDEFEIVV
jgi:transcription initiation factor TFIIE subunit alpha